MINKTGECTAYKLMPGAPVKPFSKLRRGAHEDTDKEAALMRAQFLEHQLWVTPALCNISYNSSGIPAEQTNEPSADTAMNSVDDRRADACQVSEMWELYPGGDFPNQLSVVDGLPLWTRKNRNVENTELVVWHVFGVTHLPRLEEWPIMPVEHCGFKLKPMGFFDSSPVMDVPNDRTINSMYSKGSGNCGCK